MDLDPRTCVYNGCTMMCQLNKEHSFFHFPVKSPERAAVWVRNCNNPSLQRVAQTDRLKNYVVCDRHFSLNDIITFTTRKLLQKNSVPLINYTREFQTSPAPQVKVKVKQEVDTMRTGSRRAASKEALKQLMKINETELSEQAVETMILSDDDDVVPVSQFENKSRLCTCGAIAKSGNQCSVCQRIFHMSCSSRKLFCCTGGVLKPTVHITQYRTDLSRKRNSISSRTSEKIEKIKDEIVIEEVSTTPEGKLGVENPALVLTVSHEGLSYTQILAQQKRERDLALMMSRIEILLEKNKAEVVYEGEGFKAFMFDRTCNNISAPHASSSALPVSDKNKVGVPGKVNASPASTVGASPTQGATSQSNVGLSFVVDPRSGQVVGTVSANSQTLAATSRKRRNFNVPGTPPAGPQSKMPKVGNTGTASSPLVSQTKPQSQKAQNGAITPGSKQTVNAQKHSSVAAVVDLTAEEGSSTVTVNHIKPSPDTKEVAFNKIQGKTFPSLVVVARPNLNVPPVASPLERSKLDMRVKSILVYQPSKFTEWLIQQGLVKSEQYCSMHNTMRLKLGMYSDAAKFPFSGGYVWISDCCPQKFVSVFNGSIFEGSPHPPSVIIKLMYHWACQTNVQNVIQWVKVENLYVKGLYTWLRAVCTVGLHSHLHKLGGSGVKVEIGVISLGTTTHDGCQRQVKVEVLGILETDSKKIRLRAVVPFTDSDRLYRKRFFKILEPLYEWVHPESTIVTDQTVDRNTLLSMGFKFVQQTSGGSGNYRIMDYLRKIVPRMFQNTLSLLSRQIIQQFLDELVWREWFGTTPAEAFDNIILHLSEQTRTQGKQPLMIKLNKIATNPFRNWNLSDNESNPQTPSPLVDTANKKIKRKNNITSTPSHETLKPAKTGTSTNSPDYPESMVNLENYYYGTIDDPNNNLTVDDELNKFRCHLCKEPINNNLYLMRHYFKHAQNIQIGFQCHYCLASVGTKDLLLSHIQEKHPSVTKNPLLPDYNCVICAQAFPTPYQLGKHMSTEHLPSELPYKCGSCGFRSSSHKETVDHFYTAHNNHPILQCPFCLKSSVITHNNKNAMLHYFYQHLQKHQKKNVAKPCKKCCLWFVQKEAYAVHVNRMHESVRRSAGLKPWPVEHNGLLVPRSTTDEGEDEEEEIDISGLVMVDVPEDAECKECGERIGTIHYEAVLPCTNENCQYVTCCKRAMDKHLEDCKGICLKLPTMILPFEMFCVCGYKDKDGNSMAKHLAVCERTSAYPSQEAARAATVTHSMLDVLGLVRRPEEQPTTISDSDTETKKTEDDGKTEEENSTESDVLIATTINSDSENEKSNDGEDKKSKGDNERNITENEEEKSNDAVEKAVSDSEDDAEKENKNESNKADDDESQSDKEKEATDLDEESNVSSNKKSDANNEETSLDAENDLEKLLQGTAADIDCGKSDDFTEMLLAN